MEKLNLFQLIHRGNILVDFILKWSKTRLFWFIIGGFIGIVCVTLYDGYQEELFLSKNQRVIDSLNVEISVNQRENEALIVRAKELDILLEEERGKVKTVVNNFSNEKRPEIKTSDSAVKFIYNFIRK